MNHWCQRVWVACLVTGLLSTFAYAGINDGLTVHYPFNGNAIETSGANSGVVQGSATFAPGFQGLALNLSQEGDYVSIPASSNISLNSGSKTISVWFKPDRQAHAQNAVLDKTSISDYDLVVLTNANPTRLKLRFRAHDGAKFRTISTEIPASQWINAVIVKDGSNITLYTNGSPAGTTEIGAILANNKPLIVGAGGSRYTPGYSFTGLIQDLRFYDRALAPTEVQSLYEASHPTTPTPTRTTLICKSAGGSTQFCGGLTHFWESQ